MNEKIKAIQEIIGTTPDGIWGPKSELALEAVIHPSVPHGERHINQRGLDLVKDFEGWYPRAYKDEVGVWTIGWGHTGLTHKDGTVFPGREITKEEGEVLLKHDMRYFENRVQQFVKVPLTDDQFAALVSFDFNTGGLGRSTLLKLLNEAHYDLAADEFLKWNKAGGTVYAGLTRRRKSERNLFLGKTPYIVEA